MPSRGRSDLRLADGAPISTQAIGLIRPQHGACSQLLPSSTTMDRSTSERLRKRDYQRKRRKDPALRRKDLAVVRRSKLKRFGITQEQYNEISKKQHGRCALCKKPETSKRNGRILNLAVDHDHRCCPGNQSCGKCIRGLLCVRCNNALGLVDDNIELLKAFIDYLSSNVV